MSSVCVWVCVADAVDKEHAEVCVEEARSEAFSKFMKRLIERRTSLFHVSVELLSAPLR